MKITYQTAKLAKEKGFNGSSSEMYSNQIKPQLESFNQTKWTLYRHYFLAPEQSELQAWLRNKHNIHLEIPIGRDENKLWFDYSLYSMTRPVEYEEEAYEAIAYSAEGFDTYEEALEEALQVGLTLIDKND